MAVYTEVTPESAQALATHLRLGSVQAFQGILGGIENTNYFLTTNHQGQTHEYVLTLFERLDFTDLPYYLHLMQHLAIHNLDVPKPQATANGAILHTLEGKPCCVVNKLAGASILQPTVGDCAQVARMLARMHLVGASYPHQQANLRGLLWWNTTALAIRPYLTDAQLGLLESELARQNQLTQSTAYASLPKGPIHADLFRDNVLFSYDSNGLRRCAFFDFYFAGTDAWLFDIAVCLNDWCIQHPSPAPDLDKQNAFLEAYAMVRPLTEAEYKLLPDFLRAAALRFWISRVWDLHLPRSARILKAHDPNHFEQILHQRNTYETAYC